MAQPTVKLECFFDCSSPWTYLGFHSLEGLARRLAIEVIWKPILVGGVFNKVNLQAYARRERPEVPRKNEYELKDMLDWARFLGLTIHFPPKCGHPVNSVRCMRACIAVQPQGLLPVFARAAFEALWRDGRDLASDETLTDICRVAGVGAGWVLEAIARQELKDALRANTDELIERNGFGSPTFFVDDEDMYFGNDRIVLVEAAVRRVLEE